jgi:very-short-patch-repair endonuclease
LHPKDKTTPRIRGTTPEIDKAARELRRQLTPSEERLWEALIGRKLGGLKFRCQHPTGPFVLDFYCAAARLVVEVDGGIHLDPEQRKVDAARTEQLNAYGYRVIRFRNEEVVSDLAAVLDRILAEATARCRSRTNPRG